MSFGDDPRKPIVACMTALLMASCATVAPNTTRLLPPALLLEDCPVPGLDPSTNAAIAQGILDLRLALMGCNADKAALREWAKE
jgi:hypothetical protein